jgi:hypothetical protein
VNGACSDLCGGSAAMRIPTANSIDALRTVDLAKSGHGLRGYHHHHEDQEVHRPKHKRLNPRSPPGRPLTVREIGALSDLDNITVRIADVATNLAVFGNRFREELGTSTFP